MPFHTFSSNSSSSSSTSSLTHHITSLSVFLFLYSLLLLLPLLYCADVCCGVPEDFPFEPVCRKEVGNIEWIDIRDIKDYKSFAVVPFFGKLKKWIKRNNKNTKKERKEKSRPKSRTKSRARSLDKLSGRDKLSCREKSSRGKKSKRSSLLDSGLMISIVDDGDDDDDGHVYNVGMDRHQDGGDQNRKQNDAANDNHRVSQQLSAMLRDDLILDSPACAAKTTKKKGSNKLKKSKQ